MSASAFSLSPLPFRESHRGRAPAAPHCGVCRSADVRTDTVDASSNGAGEFIHLAECGHCDHRWTWRSPTRLRANGAAAPRRVRRERGTGSGVASAA